MPVANPVSASQYRLAQAVLSGTAREGSMSHAAAREIVDATPPRLRSAFMEQRQNLFGFGETTRRTTFSSALLKQAHSMGFRGKDGIRSSDIIDDWIENKNKTGKLSADFMERLRAAYWKGEKDAENKRTAAGSYQGKRIVKIGQEWAVPSLDPESRFESKDEAKRFIAANPARRIMGKKRNPEGAAVAVYEEFHGHPPETDTIVETEIHEHGVLPGIGELCWLYIRCEDDKGEYDVRLDGFDGALLAMNEQADRHPQLYIEGGDQRVNLADFGIGSDHHEMETLGRMVCVAYFTRKDHLSAEDGGEAEYVHVIEPPLDEDEFAEWGLDDMGQDWDDVEEETDGAVGPDVIYDTRNRLLMLSGGSYALPPEGIER